MGRGGSEEQGVAPAPPRSRDDVILPCPGWAKEPSTWTVISGGDQTYYVEAPEALAAAVTFERSRFNPYLPGEWGDAQGLAIERAETSLAKASAFGRNVSLRGGAGNWEEATLDETKTRWGGAPVSVEAMLADPGTVVIRAEEITERERELPADLLEEEARQAWVRFDDGDL